jgi:hypothetical protein
MTSGEFLESRLSEGPLPLAGGSLIVFRHNESWSIKGKGLSVNDHRSDAR